MAYFPMFVELEDKEVLVVGGGMVALRKITKLRSYGAKIRVVAPQIVEQIRQYTDVTIKERVFKEKDLNVRPIFVIAATNDHRVNQAIARGCKERNIPVNVVDDLEHCSFVFPAVVKKGTFSAGFCTGGASPSASIYFKEQLKGMLPENLDDMLGWLEAQRVELKERIPEQAVRAGVFRQMFRGCMERGRILSREEMESYINGRRKGSVALVGAGCGKADLITVRGLRLLEKCQAVVYDDLIDLELLESVPETAHRIYMGKRSGMHSTTQEEINAKLIALAKEGLEVVRLKGGDPYLFGRGGEEMLALKAAGISCIEVPGIPSAIGIPAEVGIPVTHRGASRGLHIITAHTSDTEDGLPADFDVLAGLSGTLVFLMGLRQLPKIASRLMGAGKSKDTPAAVISGGNSPNPGKVIAPLGDIAEAVKTAGLSSPAIILIGEVASLDLSAEQKPLSHITVGITGTDAVAIKQQNMLEALGAKTVRVSSSTVVRKHIELEMKHSGWLVFTSINGIHAYFQGLDEKTRKFAKTQKIAVIGAATGEALNGYGFDYDLCPEVFTSEALAKALIQVAKQEEEIVLLRSAIGNPILPKLLREAGFCVQDLAIYDLEGQDEGNLLPKLEYLTFSSASGVALFHKQYEQVPQGTTCVCIGTVTADALKTYVSESCIIAKEISTDGIVKAILEQECETTCNI